MRTLKVYVSEEERRAIELAAKAEGDSMSNVSRRALRDRFAPAPHPPSSPPPPVNAP